jgi:hypothetical protein
MIVLGSSTFIHASQLRRVFPQIPAKDAFRQLPDNLVKASAMLRSRP